MFKSFGDFLVPLMRILDDLPNRSGQSGDVIDIFERRYSDEIAPTKFTLNKSGRIRWIQDVRWSREKLKFLGFLDAPNPGIWRLTDEGHQWLVEHPEATHLSIQKPKSKQKKSTTPPISVRKAVTIQSETERGFLAALQEYLPGALQPIIGSTFYEFIQRSNYLQIRLAGFPGCHYELILRRGKHEIALHFESSAERSQVRLRGFEPYIESLSQKLRMPVHAGDFGSRGWTQVYIETRPKPLTETLAKEYADLVGQFVTATFPILKNLYAGEKTAHNTTHSIRKFSSGHPMHAILDQEILNIRLCLEGRNSQPISDEKLCDWVNFCYIFGLYSEGRELFSLVNGADVNPWYFERTKRIARVCEQKQNLLELRKE